MCVQVGKLVYCTRTVPEMEKVLAELQVSSSGGRFQNRFAAAQDDGLLLDNLGLVVWQPLLHHLPG
jgi:hypothetical protein